MRTTIFLGLIPVALLVYACGPRVVTVTMTPDNNSGQSGTAVLTESGASTEVKLSLTLGNASGSQVAHIHTGKCGELGPAQFPLTNVVDGGSLTQVSKDIAYFLASPHAVNVHSSADQSVYVSCGNIK